MSVEHNRGPPYQTTVHNYWFIMMYFNSQWKNSNWPQKNAKLNSVKDTIGHLDSKFGELRFNLLSSKNHQV